MQATSDDEIRCILQSGDGRAAAAAALRTHGGEVLGFLLAALHDRDDADDVFAEVAERLWRTLPSFRWECSLRTWIYTVANHELLRFRGRAARAARRAAPLSEAHRVVAQVRTETAPYLKSALRGKLTELRELLSVEDRALLVLRLDRALPWDDVARAFLSLESHSADAIGRESARLRKRYQLVKERLASSARARGLLLD